MKWSKKPSVREFKPEQKPKTKLVLAGYMIGGEFSGDAHSSRLKLEFLKDSHLYIENPTDQAYREASFLAHKKVKITIEEDV